MSFLKAEWRKLAFANYKIDPKLLKAYVPKGTELDLWAGACYVSLVGFMFKNVRVLGLPIPWHRNFEEVNLRFYVKHKTAEGDWRRGVVFVKEIVPRSAITFVANTLYKEHYETQKMRHTWKAETDSLYVAYDWQSKGAWQHFSVHTEPKGLEIPIGGEEEFITEHYFGYTQADRASTFEYEVTHPRWLVYPTQSSKIDVDFGAVYGAEWAFLTHSTPSSVMLAEGSAITVEGKRKLN